MYITIFPVTLIYYKFESKKNKIISLGNIFTSNMPTLKLERFIKNVVAVRGPTYFWHMGSAHDTNGGTF